MSQMRHMHKAKEYCKIDNKIEDLRNELHFTRLQLCDKDDEIEELNKLLHQKHEAKMSSSSSSSSTHHGSLHRSPEHHRDLDQLDGHNNVHHCNHHHHHHHPHHQHHAEHNSSRPSSRSSSHDYQQMADLIEHLRMILQEKENALLECQERNRFFCQSIARLQEECQTKDALVVELQNEIDKFRQVVKPLTQVFLQHHKNDYDDLNCAIGMESTRVFPSTSEPKRIKRQGYSAEPLIDLLEAEDKLMKIPKSAE